MPIITSLSFNIAILLVMVFSFMIKDLGGQYMLPTIIFFPFFDNTSIEVDSIFPSSNISKSLTHL